MSAQQPIDVRDMKIVHETFRNLFSESARLLRANPTPSAARVTFLADHVDFGTTMLHHHHASEDELLYPLLATRVPEQADMVEQVEHQHQEVTGTVDAVTSACGAWRASPTAENALALADRLDELNAVLQPHLDDEEQKIVPLAAITLTEAEWETVGEHSQAQIPKDKMAVAFGMLLEPLGEADRSYMKGHLPFPIRLLFPVLIQRPWNTYARTLREGT